MKRSLALAFAAVAVAAAFVPAAPASADHLCIYSSGRPLWCADHLHTESEEYCVTRNGTTIVCVP